MGKTMSGDPKEYFSFASNYLRNIENMTEAYAAFKKAEDLINKGNQGDFEEIFLNLQTMTEKGGTMSWNYEKTYMVGSLGDFIDPEDSADTVDRMSLRLAEIKKDPDKYQGFLANHYIPFIEWLFNNYVPMVDDIVEEDIPFEDIRKSKRDSMDKVLWESYLINCGEHPEKLSPFITAGRYFYKTLEC